MFSDGRIASNCFDFLQINMEFDTLILHVSVATLSKWHVGEDYIFNFDIAGRPAGRPNLQTAKNREDGSKFDDFRTK